MVIGPIVTEVLPLTVLFLRFAVLVRLNVNNLAFTPRLADAILASNDILPPKPPPIEPESLTVFCVFDIVKVAPIL